MKKVSILSLIALLAIVISSCGSSNSVVSNNVLSKRKYNKGFFLNRKGNLKTDEAKVKHAELKEDKAIAKAERVEARKVRKANQTKSVENTFALEESQSNRSHALIAPNYTNNDFAQKEQTPIETRALLSDDIDGIQWTVTENQPSETGESIKQKSTVYAADAKKKSSGAAAVDGMTVLLVILALFIPPLAVFLFEGATSRFWIDLLLAILGIGLGIGLGGLAYLAGLAAVIYALLIVLSII